MEGLVTSADTQDLLFGFNRKLIYAAIAFIIVVVIVVVIMWTRKPGDKNKENMKRSRLEREIDDVIADINSS